MKQHPPRRLRRQGVNMKLYKVIINSAYGKELLQLARSEEDAARQIINKYDFVVLAVKEVKP